MAVTRTTKVNEIIARAYSLLNHPTDEELGAITAMEQYAVTASEMQFENILGNINPEIRKATIVFTDDTGIKTESLAEFTEDVVFARFEETAIPVVPVNTLDIYKDSSQQAAAFYKDSSTGTVITKVELAKKIPGTLEVWYEPRYEIEETGPDLILLEDDYKYLLSVRLAYNLCKYVNFNDPKKDANKMMLLQGLKEQSEYAKDLYKTKVNRLDVGNRPYTKLPYMAR